LVENKVFEAMNMDAPDAARSGAHFELSSSPAILRNGYPLPMNPHFRFSKRLFAWLCLAMMLFAQGAYAMQACVAVESAMDEMPCHQQQQDSKNLCQNHCLASQQTLDLSKVPAVAPAAELPALAAPLVPAVALASASCAKVRWHAGAPPLPILHCRFHI